MGAERQEIRPGLLRNSSGAAVKKRKKEKAFSAFCQFTLPASINDTQYILMLLATDLFSQTSSRHKNMIQDLFSLLILTNTMYKIIILDRHWHINGIGATTL